jgi:hypothetical protein
MLKFRDDVADTLLKIEQQTEIISTYLFKTDSPEIEEITKIGTLYDNRKALIDKLIVLNSPKSDDLTKKMIDEVKTSINFDARIKSIKEKDSSNLKRLKIILDAFGKQVKITQQQKSLQIYFK